MGICESSSRIGDGYISNSWDWSEKSTSESDTDEPKYVIPLGKLNNRSIQISQLTFSCGKSCQLSRPLFATSSSIFKSQDTISRSASSCVCVVPLTEVTPKLFFGSFEDASNDEILASLGITHIISLVGHQHLIKGMKHKHKPMNDFGKTDLKGVINTLWSFVLESQEAQNKLFVHCQSGQNRSATVVLAILMKLRYGLNKLIDLYRMVKNKRPIIQINERYAKQLSDMEREIFGETSVPSGWMKINSYDMESGEVLFNDRAVMQQRLGSKRKARQCELRLFTQRVVHLNSIRTH